MVTSHRCFLSPLHSIEVMGRRNNSIRDSSEEFIPSYGSYGISRERGSVRDVASWEGARISSDRRQAVRQRNDGYEEIISNSWKEKRRDEQSSPSPFHRLCSPFPVANLTPEKHTTSIPYSAREVCVALPWNLYYKPNSIIGDLTKTRNYGD